MSDVTAFCDWLAERVLCVAPRFSVGFAMVPNSFRRGTAGGILGLKPEAIDARLLRSQSQASAAGVSQTRLNRQQTTSCSNFYSSARCHMGWLPHLGERGTGNGIGNAERIERKDTEVLMAFV